MFPARFIFGVLCIIQVQRVDFTNQEGFNTGLVTLLCYSVRFFGYCQLLCLVIEMLYQQENILVEIDLFLPDFRKHYIPVAFRYPRESTQSTTGFRPGGRPMPMRTRYQSRVPSLSQMERSPL